jgi:methyl-accepting chemotaxis protein
MFKDTKIATKLYVGFATLLLVMLCVGVLARQYLAAVTTATIDIGDTRVPGMNSLQSMSIGQLRIGAGIHALNNRRMMDPKTRQNNFNEITIGFEILHAARASYEGLTHAPEEAKLWQQLQPVLVAWQRDIDSIVATHKEKDHLVAQGIGLEDPKIAQLDSRAFEQTISARDSRVESGRILAELTQINANLGKQVVTGAAAAASQGNSWILFAILLGAAASVAIAIGIARSVNSTLNALRLESTRLTQAAIDGKLGIRGNVTAVPLEFRNIIEGLNATLDAVIDPLNVAADYVDKISKGQLPPRITNNYNGDFNTIKNNLNQCIEAIERLVTDSQALSQSAISGRLETRADASRHAGDFRRIVEGINQTLDAIIGPIMEATRVLESLSQYDLRVRVKGEYQGDHARIKHALNSTGTALHDALTQVAEAVEQLSDASQQIASSSQSVAQGASEQASSLEETSASLEEMASMTKQNADNTVQARTLAQMTKQAAENGGVSMTRMTDAMEKIRAAAEGTAQIIKDINDIAFQTNLLALNAAVEAARAGEAGRGFAVVAEEVRNLALRSKEAAKKTEDLIRMSVSHTENGLVITDEVATSLTEIVDAASKVNDIIGEIAVASQEQSRGIEQVNTAVSEMDKVVQTAAANAEESSSAAEELSSQSEELSGLVGRFQLDRASVNHARRTNNSAESRTRSAAAKRPPPIRQKFAVGGNGSRGQADDELVPLHSDVTFKDF